MQKARLLWTGRSQAVRLPKEFRFEGTEVSIRRDGEAVILEVAKPAEDEWAWLDMLRPLDDDVIEAMGNLNRCGPDDPEGGGAP